MQIELIGTIIYAGLTTITTLIAYFKNLKDKKTIEKVREINKYAQVVQKLPEMIEKTEEQVGAGNGIVKKTIVMQNAEIECQNKNIKFDMPAFDCEIEKILKTPQATIYKKEQEKENEQEKTEIDTQN